LCGILLFVVREESLKDCPDDIFVSFQALDFANFCGLGLGFLAN
jgi:hypothetical protein